MDTAHLRRSFNLHRSKVLIAAFTAVLLLGGHTRIQAQEYKYVRKHLERYDDKVIHYGFFFATPITRFTVKHSPAFITQDSAYRIYSPNKFSFRVGFVINSFINDRFDVRLTPSVSLYSREVVYDYPNSGSQTQTRESTWLDFPLLIKYKSERRNNSRMYLLAGGAFAIETNVRRNEAQGTRRLNTGTMDFAVEYGVGFEQFFEFFKFAPELRFSHGLVNLYRPSASAAGIGINKLTTHTVTLYLNFE